MLQSNAEFHLYCFGGFSILANNTENIDLGTQKARALIAYLAIESPRGFRRRHLAGLLWGDYSEERALHNLRQTLYQIKSHWLKFCDQQALLISFKDTISINPKIPLFVDVLAFEALHDQAFKYFREPTVLDHLNIHALNRAMALFKAPFLDRFRLNDTPLFNEWATFQRERNTQKAVEGFRYLVDYYERRGEYAQAGQLANRLIALNPWDESAYALSMRLDAICGQWEAASRKYRQIQTFLRENLDISPQPSTKNLYQKIKSISLNKEAFPRKYSQIAGFLPQQSTSFIGREKEIINILDLIANPEIRLISLIGIGGIGKTRLAIKVGHICRGLFEDGVYFISMKHVSNFEALLHQVAAVFAAHYSSVLDFREQLTNYLKEKRSLLIIDGCDELSRQSQMNPWLETLISEAQGIKVLTTSREKLGIHQEHTFLINGLDYQTGTYCSTSLPLIMTDAVALFQDRAVQANPENELSGEELPLIQKLCHLVMGHPLSIELLASATQNHSVQELVDELSERPVEMRAFSDKPASAHGIFPLIFEKSWRSLSEDQQLALCNLATFKGGFTKAAAGQIMQLSAKDFEELLEMSFVLYLDGDRFAMHDLIHQFVSNKAAEMGLWQTAIACHANYFLNQSKNIFDGFNCGDQFTALVAIESDLENFLACWFYFVNQQEIEKLNDFIELIYQFFNIRSRFNEGMNHFQETIRVGSYLSPFDPILGKLENRLAFFAYHMHQNDMALQYFKRSLCIFKDQKDLHELGLTYLGLGNAFLRIKDFTQALEYAALSLNCFRIMEDKLLQGRVMHLIGMIYQRTGDYKTSKQKFLVALALSRQAKDQRGILLRLNQLAGHACNEGDYETAEKYYLESLGLSRSFKDRFQKAIILNNLASVYRPRQAYQLEEDVLLESYKICKEIGDRDGQAIALSNLAELANVKAEYTCAIEYGKKALEIALNLGEEWTQVVAYDVLGCAYMGLDQTKIAQQCFTQAVQIAFRISAWDLVTRSLVNLSTVYMRDGQNVKAIDTLKACLAHPSTLFEYRQKAESLLLHFGEKLPEEENPERLMVVLNILLMERDENYSSMSITE
jgi:DNA-binding SARP family transcriptional activator/predicted ATPase